jgi:hypothetical protein
MYVGIIATHAQKKLSPLTPAKSPIRVMSLGFSKSTQDNTKKYTTLS